ncbi:DUF1707 domain-containing protein [Nonomuraea sp. NPDC050227]|uniref:DUF1707 domain-containing protein n=1 Tax=Nonomuraea sp. NPDC050227 TaxID=3364360 RepID=UPI0037B10B6A
MSDASSARTLPRRLLTPGRIPVSPGERQAAADRIDRARLGGSISPEQADERHAKASTAGTRDALGAALTGLPGVAPTVLPRLLSVVTLVWSGMVLVQFVVWLVICAVTARLADAWWLWSVLVGGVVVGAVWLAAEGQYRGRLSGDSR